MSCLNTTDRFEGLNTLGVELVKAVNKDGKIIGACFVVPERLVVNGQTHDAHWLFDFAVRPEVEGVGAMIFLKLMSVYPLALVIGANEPTPTLCNRLRWKSRSDVWRWVHPLRTRKLVAQYADRLSNYEAFCLKAASLLYGPIIWCMIRIAGLFSHGYKVEHEFDAVCSNNGQDKTFASSHLRAIAASKWLNTLVIRKGDQRLELIMRAGLARVTRDDFCGLARLLAHLVAWRFLSTQQVDAVELIATTGSRVQSLKMGYVSFCMPLFIWDKHKKLSDTLEELDLNNVTFASTEKIL